MDSNFDVASLSEEAITSIIESCDYKYSERELNIRKSFVKEYLVDFDQTNAAVRCGFAKAFAIEYATKFMEEPLVQKLISEARKSISTDDLLNDKVAKSQIMASLLREANYFGNGSSHSARVAALAQLVSVHGLKSAEKIEQTTIHKGGVMIIPAVPQSLSEYEKMALEQQAVLVANANE